MHITICITTVGCGCCMSMFTVSARQRNSYLRDPLSHFPVVFSPTKVTTSWDLCLLLYLPRRTITMLIPRQDFPWRLLEIYPGCQRETIHARFPRVSALGRRRVSPKHLRGNRSPHGRKNSGTQGIKDLTASSKANLHSSGLHECSWAHNSSCWPICCGRRHGECNRFTYGLWFTDIF